jgi:membrane-associated phospholipid phosphatase
LYSGEQRACRRNPLTRELVLLERMVQVAVIALTLATSGRAQVQDTILKKSPLFTGRDALLLGAFAAGTAVLAPLDMRIAARLQNPATQENRFLSRSATGFRFLGMPGSLVTGAGVYVVGRINGQRRAQSLGLHSVESMVLADLLGAGIKLAAGRQRPSIDIGRPSSFQLWRGLRGDAYQSFPSGHTITAFAFASSATREIQFWRPHAAWYVGTVLYGGASLVGASRMYNNMHWASDVMAGAAIGTIVGLKVVRYTHSHPGNGIDRKLIKGKPQNTIQVSPILFTIEF